MSTTARLRRRATVVLGALLTLTLTLTGTTPASAATTVTVTFTGKVADGKKPIAGAMLHARQAPSFDTGRATWTNTDGTFPTLDLDPTKTYAFTVSASGYHDALVAGTNEYTGTAISVSSGRVSIGTLTLTPAAAGDSLHTISGKVVNADGTPTKDTFVRFYAQPEGNYLAVKTDATGTYRYPAVPGAKYRILIPGDETHPDTWYGGGATYSQATDLTATGTYQPLPTITRPRGATISLKLTDKRQDASNPWFITAQVYSGATKRWENVTPGRDAPTQDAKGNVRLDGLPTTVPLRLAIEPSLKTRYSDYYPDWPYIYGNAKTLNGGTARAYPAGTTTLGTFDLVKLKPDVAHALTYPKITKTKQTHTGKPATITIGHLTRKTGTITFKAYQGWHELDLGTSKLTNGKATFRLPKTIPAGKWTISATIGKNRSTSIPLTVTKAKLAKKPTVTTKTFKRGSATKVNVKLGKLNTGAYPTGRVAVYVNGKLTYIAVLKKKHKGKTTVPLERHSKNIRVKVKLIDDGNIKSATSKTYTLRAK